MSQSFWDQLPKPIIGLPPMDGVTDQPFRHITKKYGNPAIMFTEFTSVEGLCHGAQRLLKDFIYDESQRPIIAQIYGTTPSYFRQAAIVACDLGFDGIDINMGCPAKNVAHSGAGAALIKTPQLAEEIIDATKQGVLDWQNGQTTQDCPDIFPKMKLEVAKLHAQLPLAYQAIRPIPVSIKTRMGYDSIAIDEWIPTLLKHQPAAITIHGRTLNQHYGGEANWEAIGQAAQLAKDSGVLILGNGDVKNATHAKELTQKYGLDGALIGRGSFGNPFVFDPNYTQPDPSKLLPIALEHAQLYEQTYSQEENYSFMPMRKHLGWYVKNFPFAKEMRIKLFTSNSSQEVADILAGQMI